MACARCESRRTRRDGHTRLGGQRWRCRECRRRFTARSTSAFSGRGFADDVIGLAVRWYVRYRLSYADSAEWLAERGLGVDRSTVSRWVRRFLPLLGEAAHRYRRSVGGRWRVDETYCRLQGRWAYCYRAIDQDGQVVDGLWGGRSPYCPEVGAQVGHPSGMFELLTLLQAHGYLTDLPGLLRATRSGVNARENGRPVDGRGFAERNVHADPCFPVINRLPMAASRSEL